MTDDHRIERTADRLLRIWPLLAILMAGVSGWLKLKFDVESLRAGQDRWQNGSEARREKSREEIASIRERLLVLETLAHLQGMARSEGAN